MERKVYFDVENIEAEKRSGGRNSFPLVVPKYAGNKGFAMGYHELEPGGEGGPKHSHPDDIIEAFFFIKGTGVLTIGDEQFPIKPNVAAWAPPGVPHQIVNTGKENLTFVWIYCPPKQDQLPG